MGRTYTRSRPSRLRAVDEQVPEEAPVHVGPAVAAVRDDCASRVSSTQFLVALALLRGQRENLTSWKPTSAEPPALGLKHVDVSAPVRQTVRAQVVKRVPHE